MSLILFRRYAHRSVIRVSSLLQSKTPKEDILVQGWVTEVQDHKKFLFLKVNDGTDTNKLQAFVPSKSLVNGKPNLGSAVKILGKWKNSEGQLQPMELLAEQCIVVGRKEDLWTEEGDNDLLRLNLPMRLKHRSFAAILRMRSRLQSFSHEFFLGKDFFHVDPPLFSLNDCEGAGETFKVTSSQQSDFFGKDTEVFLPVSTQLHLEAMIGAIPYVYTIGPTFRANTSGSSMHLAEFRMLEAECAFMDSVDDLCDLVEEYLKNIVRRLRSIEFKDDIEGAEVLCLSSTKSLLRCLDVDKPIPRIHYLEAVSILEGKGEKCISRLERAHELILAEEFGGPVFVTHLNSDGQAFYMKRTDDGKQVMSFELLVPGVGEIAGGSVREDDSAVLEARQVSNNILLKWYMDIRQSGYPKSSGFGLGVDRFMQSLLGISNVKDTVPFPRWRKHCKC